jgi:hypothetical protein
MWTPRDLGILYAVVVVLAAVIGASLGYEFACTPSAPPGVFLSR